jgi:hypothetical protein
VSAEGVVEALAWLAEAGAAQVAQRAGCTLRLELRGDPICLRLAVTWQAPAPRSEVWEVAQRRPLAKLATAAAGPQAVAEQWLAWILRELDQSLPFAQSRAGRAAARGLRE